MFRFLEKCADHPWKTMAVLAAIWLLGMTQSDGAARFGELHVRDATIVRALNLAPDAKTKLDEDVYPYVLRGDQWSGYTAAAVNTSKTVLLSNLNNSNPTVTLAIPATGTARYEAVARIGARVMFEKTGDPSVHKTGLVSFEQITPGSPAFTSALSLSDVSRAGTFAQGDSVTVRWSGVAVQYALLGTTLTASPTDVPSSKTVKDAVDAANTKITTNAASIATNTSNISANAADTPHSGGAYYFNQSDDNTPPLENLNYAEFSLCQNAAGSSACDSWGQDSGSNLGDVRSIRIKGGGTITYNPGNPAVILGYGNANNVDLRPLLGRVDGVGDHIRILGESPDGGNNTAAGNQAVYKITGTSSSGDTWWLSVSSVEALRKEPLHPTEASTWLVQISAGPGQGWDWVADLADGPGNLLVNANTWTMDQTFNENVTIGSHVSDALLVNAGTTFARWIDMNGNVTLGNSANDVIAANGAVTFKGSVNFAESTLSGTLPTWWGSGGGGGGGGGGGADLTGDNTWTGANTFNGATTLNGAVTLGTTANDDLDLQVEPIHTKQVTLTGYQAKSSGGAGRIDLSTINSANSNLTIYYKAADLPLLERIFFAGNRVGVAKVSDPSNVYTEGIVASATKSTLIGNPVFYLAMVANQRERAGTFVLNDAVQIYSDGNHVRWDQSATSTMTDSVLEVPTSAAVFDNFASLSGANTWTGSQTYSGGITFYNAVQMHSNVTLGTDGNEQINIGGALNVSGGTTNFTGTQIATGISTDADFNGTTGFDGTADFDATVDIDDSALTATHSSAGWRSWRDNLGVTLVEHSNYAKDVSYPPLSATARTTMSAGGTQALLADLNSCANNTDAGKGLTFRTTTSQAYYADTQVTGNWFGAFHATKPNVYKIFETENLGYGGSYINQAVAGSSLVQHRVARQSWFLCRRNGTFVNGDSIVIGPFGASPLQENIDRLSLPSGNSAKSYKVPSSYAVRQAITAQGNSGLTTLDAANLRDSWGRMFKSTVCAFGVSWTQTTREGTGIRIVSDVHDCVRSTDMPADSSPLGEWRTVRFKPPFNLAKVANGSLLCGATLGTKTTVDGGTVVIDNDPSSDVSGGVRFAVHGASNGRDYTARFRCELSGISPGMATPDKDVTVTYPGDGAGYSLPKPPRDGTGDGTGDTL